MARHAGQVGDDRFCRWRSGLWGWRRSHRDRSCACPDFRNLKEAGSPEQLHQSWGMETTQVGCGGTGPLEGQNTLPQTTSEELLLECSRKGLLNPFLQGGLPQGFGDKTASKP